jgi:tetratricopeptide (TPR) repeat protein
VPGQDAVARRLLSDRLLNDARAAARSAVPPTLAARHAMLILQNAASVNPEDLDILHALAEAAREAGERDILRNALRNIVKLDPGDLVAQVNLISAMAESSQTIEEQLRVYAGTLEKDALDPQVRSEIALRYARLLMQRGENDQAKTILETAVKLNDVNAAAWREIIRLQTAGPVRVSDRMSAIVSCLLADPYAPQVWLAGGQALAATNQHELAALYLGTAIDGATRLGQGSGELLLEWATELAISGDRNAEPILSQLAKLEDAPVAALLTSLAVSGPSVAAMPGDDSISRRIRAKIEELVKAAPDEKAVLAEASWIEIFYMAKMAPSAAEYVDRLARIVGENDDAVKIRRGWMLIRAGNLGDAAKILAPIAQKEPFAQLGMARIAAAGKDRKALEYSLQDIYNNHPTGLLALHTLAEARKEKITLRDTPLGQAVRKAAASLPKAVFSAQSSPRDVMLVIPSLPKRRFTFGEAIPLTLKISNTTDRALAVGPDAAIKSSFGLAATMKEPAVQTIGLYAMENSPRVYRLSARATVTQTIRIDSDRLYEMLMNNAWKNYSLGVTLVTDPKLGATGVVPGVGGQVVPAGDFAREPVQLSTPEEAAKWAESLATLTPEKQMTTGFVLAQLLPELTDERIGDGAGSEVARATREKIVAALSGALRGDSPVVKAWFLRVIPDGVPAQLQGALDAAVRSPDVEPRLAGIARMFALAHPADAEARKALHNEFAEISRKETNGLVKDFAATLAEIALVAPPEVPATSTAPASAPAARTSAPATTPATTTAPATTTSRPAASIEADRRHVAQGIQPHTETIDGFDAIAFGPSEAATSSASAGGNIIKLPRTRSSELNAKLKEIPDGGTLLLGGSRIIEEPKTAPATNPTPK